MVDQLSLSDAYSEMTSQWQKGGVYRIEMIITQTSDPGKPFTSTVDEVTDYGDADVEAEEETKASPPAPPKKPPGKKTYPAPEEEMA